MYQSPSDTVMTDAQHAATPLRGSGLAAQDASAAAAAAAALSSATSPTVPHTSPALDEVMHTQESSMSDSPPTLALAAPAVVPGEQQQSASPAPLPQAASAQAQSQAHTVRNGRDIGERSESTPSSAPIETAQGATLLPPHSPTDLSQLQPHPTSSSHSNMALNVVAGASSTPAASAAPAAASSTASSTAAPPLLAAASSATVPAASPALQNSSNGFVSSNMSSSAATGAAGAAAAARVAAPVDPHAAANSNLASMFKKCIQASARPPPSVPVSSNDVLGGPAAGNEGLRLASTDRLHGIHVCHCLVFDTSLFGGEDSKKHSGVLAANSDEVLPLVLAWQQQLKEANAGVACAMVRSARVHVQFRTHADMAAALKISPLLVQCGVVAVGWGAKECGPARHDRPEKLELTCAPNDGLVHAAADVPAAISRLLKEEMKLEYTSQWIPSQYDPVRVGTGYIVVSVLPREIGLVDLKRTVERLNDAKHKLWGGVVHAQAPNTPSLARCKECGKLGHQAGACPRYAGVALRLLFKEPAPYAMLLSLCEQMGARSESFLGHDALVLPHRKMTLLFKSMDDAVAQKIQSLMEQYGRLMHEAPRIVDVQNRLKECHECGALVKPHECPFPQLRYGQQRVAAQQQKPKQQGQQPQQQGGVRVAAAAAAAHAPASAAATPPDKMCKSWRRTRECPRLRRGERCGFEHPNDYVVPQKVCFTFRDTGHCARGGACKFPHNGPQQQEQQQQQQPAGPAAPAAAPAVAAPAVPAALPALAASAAAVPARAVAAAPVVAAAPASASKKKKAAQGVSTASSTHQPEADPDTTQEGRKPKRKKTSNNSKEVGEQTWADMTEEAEKARLEESAPSPANSSAAAAVMRQQSAPTSSLSLLTSPNKPASTSARVPPDRSNKVRNIGGALSAAAPSSSSNSSSSSKNSSEDSRKAAAAPSRTSSSSHQ